MNSMSQRHGIISSPLKYCCVAALLVGARPPGALDLRNARIAADSNLSGPEEKAIEMLVQEVQSRTGLRWLPSGSTTDGPVIRIHRATGTGPAEGFRLTLTGGAVAVQYLNKAAFKVNELGTYGTLGRNTFRGPRSFNTDFGLIRISRWASV